MFNCVWLWADSDSSADWPVDARILDDVVQIIERMNAQ